MTNSEYKIEIHKLLNKIKMSRIHIMMEWDFRRRVQETAKLMTEIEEKLEELDNK